MNQIKKLMILMLSFAYINCTCNSQLDQNYSSSILDFASENDEDFNYIDNKASKSECKKREISTFEKETLNAYKCCYADIDCDLNDFLDDDEEGISKIKMQACTTIDSSTYKNLKSLVDLEKKICKKYSINCSSSYLKIIFISFIILLL